MDGAERGQAKKAARSGENGRELFLGLMSGTSVDGIDAALIEVPADLPGEATDGLFQPDGADDGVATGERGGLLGSVKVIHWANYPFSDELRRAILSLCDPNAGGKVDEICRMNFVLGEHFARAALRLLEDAGVSPQQVRAIGSHGQTIYHLPWPEERFGVVTGSTLQIGEPAVIAERTGITVVADFRVGDVAAGGQGAPLVPFADYLLFADPRRGRIVQNIGGIGNFTYLPAGLGQRSIIASDTGPGNMVMDELAARFTGGRLRYDADGRMAAAGRIDNGFLERLLAHPFFARPLPKTTGREEFGAAYVDWLLAQPEAKCMTPEDVMATAAALTVESIAQAYEKYILPDADRRGPVDIIVGGGGGYNPTLLGMLRERLAPRPVWLHEDFGISGDAKEAIAFALLAWATLEGRPNNVPRATGARRPAIMGKIIPGWRDAYGWGKQRD